MSNEPSSPQDPRPSSGFGPAGGFKPPGFDLPGSGAQEDLASVLNRLSEEDPVKKKERAERNAAIKQSIASAQAGLQKLWEVSNQGPLTAENLGPVLSTLSNIVATLCKQNHYLLHTVMRLEEAEDRRL